MPTHIYVNSNEVASKAAAGKSIAGFPDVCFSPPAPPAGPIPLPYPNTVEVKDTDKGTAKVFIKDKMSGMGDDSYMTKSMGDDAATKNFTKGLITSTVQGKCYFGLWSMDVQMEGKGVPRHMDMVTHNHGSQPGNIVGSDLDGTSVHKAGGITTVKGDVICIINVYYVQPTFCKQFLPPLTVSKDGPDVCINCDFTDDDGSYKIAIVLSDVDFEKGTAKFTKADYSFELDGKLWAERVRYLASGLKFAFRNTRTLEVYVPIAINHCC